MRVIEIAAIRGREVGRRNAMEMEHLLRRCFVLGEKMGVWAGACVWQADQIHVSGDVHFLRVIAGVGFGEIESYVGTTFRKTMKSLRTAIENVIRRFMAEFGERVENFFPVFFFFALSARCRYSFRLGRLLFSPLVVQHGDF